ncbi:TPA: CRISPR-associated helicase Cas3' [Clostridium botulinum]|nr:CRISPR-associated helicase Cas3' [Clostridium botulinum]HBJ1652672.1 CRISPR-associated helicase Cas3' [Clostridium botulinum]
MFLSRPNESLKQHIEGVILEYNKIKIDYINKLNYSSQINVCVFQELLDNVFKYHDYGKRNIYFQEHIKHIVFHDERKREHSKLSAVKYINDMVEHYVTPLETGRQAKKQKNIISKLILDLSYNIYKHHSNLQDKPNDNIYIDSLIQHYKEYKEDKYKYIDINIENLKYIKTLNLNNIILDNPIQYYFIIKLNYAMLIKADYLAVYNFKNKKSLENNRIDEKLKNKISNNFDKDMVVDNIHKYSNSEISLSKINENRSNMFLDSEKTLLKNIDEMIFFLEAPTGSGKSTIAINLGLKLLNDIFNKMVYVSPSNNVNEQMFFNTKNKLKTNSSEMVLINSREKIVTTTEEDAILYEKDYLNYQTFNYPIIMTSHVKLFNIFFGNNKKDLLALDSLRNSIIILDEIQNYNNKNWIKQINSLYSIAKLYNIKFLIMSATLPKMEELLEDENYIKSIDLIQDIESYYSFFKQRVKYDYSLLNKLSKKNKNNNKEVLEKIDEVILNSNKNRILIETLTTKTCENFYKYLKKYKSDGFLVFKMLSITNLSARNYIIHKIQEKDSDGEYKYKKIILVGTQCIEAGIDIDMNIGFKDISMLDYDEQFTGRLERNFKDIGVCYFFDIDNDDFIYKDDYRIEYNLKNSLEYRKIFENKTFDTYYKNNYKWLLNKEIKDYNKFKESMRCLKYEKVKESMKLIDNNTYNFLFMLNYEHKNGMIDVCSELVDKINKNNKEKDYCKGKIVEKDIKTKLNNFTYSINTFQFKKEPSLELKNGYYIVENGQAFFDNLHNKNLTNKSNLNILSFKDYVNGELFYKIAV